MVLAAAIFDAAVKALDQDCNADFFLSHARATD
jgi:hypothetical protein